MVAGAVHVKGSPGIKDLHSTKPEFVDVYPTY